MKDALALGLIVLVGVALVAAAPVLSALLGGGDD